MSNSVYPSSENVLLNSYSSFLETFYDNVEQFYYKSCSHPLPEECGTTYRFSSSATVPCCHEYTQIINDSKYISSEWQSQACVEDVNTYFVNENRNFSAQESNPKSMNQENQGNNNANNGSKPRIWRPFSPAPSSQENNVVESTVHKRNTRTSNRNTFYSIKPSSVKIGPSKTSVFKAVRKNNFACTQCSSLYMSNRQLNSHMRVHTGSKPFRCEHQNCFKSFARNEELTRHKRIHSGFKPHQCVICKKRFGRKDHLSKHLKTHLQTSEKKVYQCSFPGCGHRYTRSDALTRHKSTAHAIKIQK